MLGHAQTGCRIQPYPTYPGQVMKWVPGNILGTCGFLGLPRLESVAHSGENVLGKVRDGILPISGDIVTIVLEALDRLKLIMAELEATEAEPEGDDQELIHRLDAVAAGVSLDGGAEAAAEP